MKNPTFETVLSMIYENQFLLIKHVHSPLTKALETKRLAEALKCSDCVFLTFIPIEEISPIDETQFNEHLNKFK
jgi:hypothetical protein